LVTFIDTKVLVFAAADVAPLLDRARVALARAAADGAVTISRQVLREYLSVMARQQFWGKPLTLAQGCDRHRGVHSAVRGSRG
jgi:predicted nucleic acid-binding protein